MKWLRLLTWVFLVAFVSACSVHVGPNDSTHRHSNNKHKKHKKHKKKPVKKHKKVHKKKAKASSNDDAPPPPEPSGSALTDKVRGNVPGWVVVNDKGRDNTVRPTKAKDDGMAADLKGAAPKRTKPSGALRMAPLKTGEATAQTYDLKAGDCTGYVVKGDRGVKDIAVVLTEGHGARMRVLAKDDPDGNVAVLNRGGCIDIGNAKKSVTLHVLLEQGKGKIFIQRFRR